MKSSLVHININKDNILHIQIIWTDIFAKIEDNITGQKQFYWLQYKGQFCINLSLSTKNICYVNCTVDEKRPHDREITPFENISSIWSRKCTNGLIHLYIYTSENLPRQCYNYIIELTNVCSPSAGIERAPLICLYVQRRNPFGYIRYIKI
jgi:hypothetical protein